MLLSTVIIEKGKPETTTFYANERTAAAFVSLLCVQLFFGSLPVIVKVVLSVIPPLALVGARVAITAVLLAAFQASRGRFWLREKGDYLKLAGLCVFGVLLNQYLFIGGLYYTTASNTSLLAVTIPIFTLLISAAFRFEKLFLIKVLGVVLAASGVIFLIDPRNASFESATTRGDIMIIANSLAFGIYVAISKDIVTRNGAFRSMMWVFVFASVVAVPVGVLSLSTISISSVPATIWAIMLYIGIFATAVPYILNAYALARVKPSTVAVFIYLQPMIGVILAAFFLGETLSTRFFLAAALVFAGLFCATRKNAPIEAARQG